MHEVHIDTENSQTACWPY